MKRCEGCRKRVWWWQGYSSWRVLDMRAVWVHWHDRCLYWPASTRKEAGK